MPFDLRIKAEGGDTAELFVYDFIGDYFEDVSAKDAVAAIRQAKEAGATRLLVHINSPGGSAFEGMTIHNVLAKSDMRVEVEVDGLAASAASVIAMAGDEIRIAANAFIMIHEASGMVFGNASDMESVAVSLRKVNGAMALTYAARTKTDESAVLELMAAETWMTAAEAVELGFADAIMANTPSGEADPDIAARWSPTGQRLIAACKHAPARFNQPARKDFRPAASSPNTQREPSSHSFRSTLGVLR